MATDANEPHILSVAPHLLADVGITYKGHTSGLLVTGFVKDSSAERSDLKVDDVITTVGDGTFLAGLSAFEAFDKMSGPGGSFVELLAFRITGNTKKRLSVQLDRDIAAPQREAQVGLVVKEDNNGLLISQLVPGTSAADSDLRPGDVITTIDEDFICGLKLADSAKKLQGTAASQVDLGVWRMVNGVKSRLSETITRDYKVKRVASFSKVRDEQKDIIKPSCGTLKKKLGLARLLAAVPADDWRRTWPAGRSIMMRATSKEVRTAVDALCPPAHVRLKKISCNFVTQDVDFARLEHVLTHLAESTITWCRLTTLDLSACVLNTKVQPCCHDFWGGVSISRTSILLATK